MKKNSMRALRRYLRERYGGHQYRISADGEVFFLWWGPDGKRYWLFGGWIEDIVREVLQ